ncbi:hypothetical protein [Endozoicomonas sp. SCSIO W0465]|uniref:hypothetical protein n=1 Tax=Endozoicomonas sp. SCSIO W0465 TaxID=2918516 RepID=UPI0020763B11|nr:hypothetical protein [Endozoicomonas sp. SCSIO W0465]USE39201.1 hypothetical protein MJO57_14210 [Endozoicomonas sp. SCSIO W0465]
MDITSSKPPYVQDLPRAIADVANTPLVNSQFDRKGNAVSLFKSIQDRAIRGCGISGSVADSLHFLSTLESRQLLTTAEVMALSRAVRKGECIISPEQCKFPLSINLLRWLSGFLRIMERSPAVKMAVEKTISDAPIRSVFDYVKSLDLSCETEDMEEMEDSIKECSIHNLKSLNNELRLVKEQFDNYISENQSSTVMADDTKKHYLNQLLSPLHDRLEQHPKTCLLSDVSFLNCPFADIYKDLMRALTDLDDSIQYSTCMHERIDRLDINNVLIVKKEFCEWVKAMAFQRLPDESIPSLDGMKINKLFDTGRLLDRSYAEFIKFQTVLSADFRKGEIVPRALGYKDLEHLYINYMGVHLELDLDHKKEVNLVDFVGFNSECYSALAFRFNSKEKWVGDVYRNRSVEYCYEAFQQWFKGERVISIDAMRLFHQLWRDDYSKVDNITWLVSVIARAGLVPCDPPGFSVLPSLFCPDCNFSGNIKKVENSGRSDGPESIRQPASELIQLLQHHRERDCNLARSIDPQRLWNEKYQGKLPSGD